MLNNLEHMVYDFDEFEMTDIEERAQQLRSDIDSDSHSASGDSSKNGDNRSVKKGSILNSPRNYQFNPAARFSDISVTSSSANFAPG